MRTGPALEDTLGSRGQSWLDFSVFAFSTPELENLFRTYNARLVNTWTLINATTVLMGCILFTFKSLRVSRDSKSVPASMWLSGLLNAFATVSLISLLLFRPAFHKMHQRALNTAVTFFFIITYPVNRSMVLLMKFVDGRAHSETWLHEFQLFGLENVFTSTTWMATLACSTGQLPDLALATLFMFRAMASNATLCASPEASNLVTMRPVYLSAARMTSVWVTDIAGPLVGGHASDPVLSCPAALGIWEVVGWQIACLTVLVTDILRRRAFLRTREVHIYLGPAYLAGALNWPFSSSKQCRRCIMALLVLLYSSSLLWNTALPLVG